MRSIDITTTQNVTIEYELAPLRERILAFFLDLMIVGIGYILLIQLLLMIFANLLSSGDFGWLILLLILPYGVLFAYNLLFEILNIGQTPGKMAMSIKTVRLDGKDPEWSDVLLRALLHLVDSIFSAGVIGSLLIKISAKSQRFGDMAAGTTVIKLPGAMSGFRLDSILNISSLETYQPFYPQVRELHESDMIFIKNTLARSQRYPNQAHHEAIEDLVSHLMPLLKIEQRPYDRVEFLKTLLRDYIVLTR